MIPLSFIPDFVVTVAPAKPSAMRSSGFLYRLAQLLQAAARAHIAQVGTQNTALPANHVTV